MSPAEKLLLRHGGHTGSAPDGPCCLVEYEVVHVLKRTKKADTDPTICPVINAMATGLNDAYPDNDAGDVQRTAELERFIGRLKDTKSTPEVERRRSHLACDWLIRTYTPAWLRLVPSLVDHAEALTALPEITDGEVATSAQPTISAAGSAAGSAADSAASSAAYSAARSADDSAAYSAAYSAARSAACAAADDLLKPTADSLRASAIELLERMLAVTE